MKAPATSKLKRGVGGHFCVVLHKTYMGFHAPDDAGNSVAHAAAEHPLRASTHVRLYCAPLASDIASP